MRIIFIAQPAFLNQPSMQRYARLLVEGMSQYGHETEIWTPEARFARLWLPKSQKRWLGYLDQFVIFPAQIYHRLKSCSADTIFVVTDHALGPYLPLVAHRPHVVHCHDFLAQHSALGHIPQNNVKWTGRQYQAFIRWGYRHGQNFVSVSAKTRNDLHRFLDYKPDRSEVIYNGLNRTFQPINSTESRLSLSAKTTLDLTGGYILHVGGDPWYKNRPGVIQIYNALRTVNPEHKMPLVLVGHPPTQELQACYQGSPYKDSIHFLTDINDQYLQYAYAGASVLLFPSLAEGFGWPIAEAMATGCPVVTTQAAPMTEVGGTAGFYIPVKPTEPHLLQAWAVEAAAVVQRVLTLSDADRAASVQAGIANSHRFDTSLFLNRLEELYESIVNETMAVLNSK